MIPLPVPRPASVHLVLPSPNLGARPPEVMAIACVVLHATADGGNELGAEGWLRNPRSGASAHLHIRRDGTVVRLVADELRAWHAGGSVWRGRRGVNDFSLGWELANRNDGREPYSDAQHTAVAALAVHYIRQGLEPAAVVSHAEVALPAGRKVDPLGFDWRRFRRDTELLLTLLPP